MTREQIEKAAGEYSGSVLGFKDNPVVMANHKAFMDGAQWRINSVWHDATKYKPRIGSKIAVLFSDEDFAICIFESEMKNAFPYLRIKCWAYLDDLLPDRKENEQ